MSSGRLMEIDESWSCKLTVEFDRHGALIADPGVGARVVPFGVRAAFETPVLPRLTAASETRRSLGRARIVIFVDEKVMFHEPMSIRRPRLAGARRFPIPQITSIHPTDEPSPPLVQNL